MRKRTRPRVAWLPHDDSNTIQFSAPHAAGFSNVIDFVVAASGVAPGNCVTAAVPIVIDVPQDATVGTTTLSDIENSGYRLRRIVGKCHVGVTQVAQGAGPALLLIAAAFIILRVNNAGGPAFLSALSHYDLFDIQNDDSPWIWRREWILKNSVAANPSTLDYPHTNTEYGSAADGPHIDQKTARVIMSDERLFFVASVMNLTTGVTAQDETDTIFHLTTRVLGSMRPTLGNRRNASR